MFNQIRPSFAEDKKPCGRTKARMRTQSSFLALSALSVLSACVSTPPPTEPMVETEMMRAGDTYVAFAGGGWRAHTGHSAWMVGLLDNEPNNNMTTLDDAFKNVSAISSNSGGSWFNVMLSYSDTFREGLEKPSASSQYLTDMNAYYANEKALYQTLSGVTLSPLCKLSNDFSNLLAMACMTNLDWNRLVEGIVFEPLNMSSELENVTMGGPQAWADRKTIALAATALSGDVVLARNSLFEGHHEFYYNAPQMGPLNVSPVTFAGTANSTDPVPPFFPGGAGAFDINYGRTNLSITEVAPGNKRDLDSHNINVIHAASGSSAALGFISSRSINENNKKALSDINVIMSDWQIAYEADNLAIYFNLPDPAKSSSLTRYITGPQTNVNNNTESRYIKIADGGALDNSGVAHSVLVHQQKYDKSVPFEIISFDIAQKTYAYTSASLETGMTPVDLVKQVGIDTAFLFGEGYTTVPDTTDSGMCVGDYCITTDNGTVTQQVFETKGLDGNIIWQWPPDGTSTPEPCTLFYAPYAVDTIANPMMGIKADYTGTLHSFTAYCPSAATAPSSASDWTDYEDMFNAIQTGLKQGGGLAHLKAAFGL